MTSSPASAIPCPASSGAERRDDRAVVGVDLGGRDRRADPEVVGRRAGAARRRRSRRRAGTAACCRRSTSARYSCTITCRLPPRGRGLGQRTAAASSSRSSQTSIPANPSTGLTTAAPTRPTKRAHLARVGGDQGRGAQLREPQRDQLLVQRADAGGAVDDPDAGGLDQVEQVRRVQVAGVDRRVDPQQRQVDLRGHVDGRAARPRRTRAGRPASGGRRRGAAAAATIRRARRVHPTADDREVLGPADPDLGAELLGAAISPTLASISASSAASGSVTNRTPHAAPPVGRASAAPRARDLGRPTSPRPCAAPPSARRAAGVLEPGGSAAAARRRRTAARPGTVDQRADASSGWTSRNRTSR